MTAGIKGPPDADSDRVNSTGQALDQLGAAPRTSGNGIQPAVQCEPTGFKEIWGSSAHPCRTRWGPGICVSQAVAQRQMGVTARGHGSYSERRSSRGFLLLIGESVPSGDGHALCKKPDGSGDLACRSGVC